MAQYRIYIKGPDRITVTVVDSEALVFDTGASWARINEIRVRVDAIVAIIPEENFVMGH